MWITGWTELPSIYRSLVAMHRDVEGAGPLGLLWRRNLRAAMRCSARQRAGAAEPSTTTQRSIVVDRRPAKVYARRMRSHFPSVRPFVCVPRWIARSGRVVFTRPCVVFKGHFIRFVKDAMNLNKYMSRFIEDVMNIDIQKCIQNDKHCGTEEVLPYYLSEDRSYKSLYFL